MWKHWFYSEPEIIPFALIFCPYTYCKTPFYFDYFSRVVLYFCQNRYDIII